MQFPAHAKSRLQGFTLVEVLLVLAVIAVIIGMSIPSAKAFFKHQEIQDACKSLQTLAATAHKESILNHKDYYIVLKTSGFALYADDKPDTPIAEEEIDSNIAYEIKLWPSTESTPPNDTRWYFSASGLVYPLFIKMTMDNAWKSLDFDPLTGGVLEERYEFP